jgi:hypothetical protein
MLHHLHIDFGEIEFASVLEREHLHLIPGSRFSVNASVHAPDFEPLPGRHSSAPMKRIHTSSAEQAACSSQQNEQP